MAPSYLARFGGAGGEFFVAVLAWPAPAGAFLPPAWWRLLRATTDLDIALRLAGGKEPGVVLLLTADRTSTLTPLVEALRSTSPPAMLQQADDATGFNALTRVPFPKHLRVHHAGYHLAGEPLGCDFRLYTAWVGQGLPEGVAYQVALRSHLPGAEQERRVRKYLARLELEQPFSTPVRQMQEILSRRLLAAGWLADEYLLFSDSALRAAWQQRIHTHFSETIGRIGFRELPLEQGEFSDWLSIGCHTARDGGPPAVLPVEAACTFSNEEAALLVRQTLGLGGAGTIGVAPAVFVSYASADFAMADATRQHLEDAGWQCWIAPRDVNAGGLPYTEAIPQAINQVRAVVVLLSASANLSVHIPRELDLALARRLPVVPLRLAELAPEGQLDYLLRTCQWLDVFGRDQHDALRELTGRLRALGL